MECNAPTGPGTLGFATATDNCDTAPVVTFTDNVQSDSCPQNVFIVRTWRATDACGNTVTADQVITVVDTTPPVITAPGSVTVKGSMHQPRADSQPTAVPVQSSCPQTLG